MNSLLVTDPRFVPLLADLPATATMTATLAAYEAAADRLRLLQREELTVGIELDEVASQMVDATGKTFTSLLNRRTELLYRRQVLPPDLAAAKEAHRLAAIAWLSAVGRAAQQQADTAVTALAASRPGADRLADRLRWLPDTHPDRKALHRRWSEADARERALRRQRDRMCRLRDLATLCRQHYLPRVHSLAVRYDLDAKVTVRHTDDGGHAGQKVTIPARGQDSLFGHTVTWSES